ncbi:MAG: hypothetical protein M1815_001290 [Lichina confinis]|nr:MAG: hypothetical protein M1815_001290 [Lichina confinis]
MVLEATMIIIDNSESSRNGDYPPSRFEAQAEAVSRIFFLKTTDNPESKVGLMSMGGKGPEVLVTLSSDFGKILEGVHRTKIGGSTHFATSIQIAGLALKHRQNKSQRQRVIVFCCSPIAEDEKTLVKLAKKMKKVNISIDLVAFGELEGENIKKLEAFNENVTGAEGSHLATIPPGPNLLSEILATTQIMGGDGSSGGAGAGAEGASGGEGAVNGFDFGVDPSMEPELALALRVSLEEEKARIDKEKREQEAAEGKKNLEGIPEEGDAKPSTAGDKKDGDPSPDAGGSGSKDGQGNEGDRMDTT